MESDKENYFSDDSNGSLLQPSHKRRRVISQTLSEECSSSNSSEDLHLSSTIRRCRIISDTEDENDTNEDENYNTNSNEWSDIIEINSHVIPFVRSSRIITQHLGNEMQDFYYLLVTDETLQTIVDETHTYAA